MPLGRIFWGAGITGIPVALAITDTISISSPIQLALMVIAPMLLSIWIFLNNTWRVPFSLAMLVFGKFSCGDSNDLLDTVVATLGFATIITLVMTMLKVIAVFHGPWIEFKRDTRSMKVYKSRANKKLLQEIHFSNLAYGFNIREVRVGKYSTLISYFFSAYDQQTPYELDLLFSHSRSESPPADYLETYGPLCAAVPIFLEEWASGKTDGDMQGIQVIQSEENNQISIG